MHDDHGPPGAQQAAADPRRGGLAGRPSPQEQPEPPPVSAPRTTAAGSPAPPEPRPEGYDPGAFPPFAVTADIVLLTVVERRLKVLLIRRGGPPYEGAWALPGGFVRPDEDLTDAAVRELAEETGISWQRSRLRQIGAYGDPDRDPRMRVVTVAFLATVARLAQVPRGGSDAAVAELVPLADVHGGLVPLAFDHRRILDDAVSLLAGSLEASLSLRKPADRAGAAEPPAAEDRPAGALGEAFALGLSPAEFTIRELQEVYEAVLGTELDPGNFQRTVRGRPGFIAPTEQRATPGRKGGRPATRWRPAPPEA